MVIIMMNILSLPMTALLLLVHTPLSFAFTIAPLTRIHHPKPNSALVPSVTVATRYTSTSTTTSAWIHPTPYSSLTSSLYLSSGSNSGGDGGGGKMQLTPEKDQKKKEEKRDFVDKELLDKFLEKQDEGQKELIDEEEVTEDDKDWLVILHDDDYHLFEYVEQCLVEVVPTLDERVAHSICRETHVEGQAIVTKTWRQQAEEYCIGLQRCGLTSSIIPEKDGQDDDGDEYDSEGFDDE